MDMKLIEQIIEQGYIFIEDYWTTRWDEPVIKKERVGIYQVSIKRVPIKRKPEDCKGFAIYAAIETPYGDFNVEDRNVTWWLADPAKEDTTT